MALGLLYSEGRIGAAGDVESVEALDAGRVRVALAAHVDLDLGRARAATAACGFCGSPDLPVTEALADKGFRVTLECLAGLSAKLEARQGQFQETGAVHAAAMFDAAGELVAVVRTPDHSSPLPPKCLSSTNWTAARCSMKQTT